MSSGLLGYSFSRYFDFLLINLDRDYNIGFLGGFFTMCPAYFCFFFSHIGFLECFGLVNLFGCYCFSLSYCFFLSPFGIGLCNLNCRYIFSIDCIGIGISHLYALVFQSVCFADGPIPVLFCHALLGIIDGLGSRLLTECFNISGFIINICNIYIDQFQTNLFQFSLHIT